MVEVSTNVKHRIIREYMSTPKRRAKLAQAMYQPLKTRLEYLALWCKILAPAGVDRPLWDPIPFDVSFEVDPDKPDTLEGGQQRATELLWAQGEATLVDKLTQDQQWNEVPDREGSTFQDLLENNREFAKQPGGIVVNAHTYADFRHHCQNQLDLEERPELVENALPVFEQMRFHRSGFVDRGLVLFVPKSTGRYAHTLSITSSDDPGPQGMPMFQVLFKLCLEVDPEAIRAFAIKP